MLGRVVREGPVRGSPLDDTIGASSVKRSMQQKGLWLMVNFRLYVAVDQGRRWGMAGVLLGCLIGNSARAGANEAPAPQVISRGAAAGPYQAFCDVCRLREGDLLCVFYAGYGHVSLPSEAWPRGGRICSVRSADEGRTWTEPVVLYDGPDDDRDPHIAVLPDGKLVCSFFPYRQREGRTEFETCIVASADGGKTWEAHHRVLAAGWACSAPVRVLRDGTCLLGVYFADDARAYGGVLRSQNAGKTWSEPIAIGKESGVRLDAETDVVQLGDGSLYAALRTERENMYYDTSRDGGLTWSGVRPIGFPGHCPHFLRLSSGVVLLTHRLPNTALHVSRDECATWQGPYEIDQKSGAYASTAELKDGSVLVVYYEEGEGSAIRARRFRLTDTGPEFVR